MAALSTREEENRIILYKSTDDRLVNLIGGTTGLAILLILFFSSTNMSRYDNSMKSITPGFIILLLFVAIPLTKVLFATTIIVDGNHKKLYRLKKFLDFVYSEHEISFTTISKIRIIQIPAFGKTEEYAWDYAAITRDKERIMLNHSGYASQIIFWAKQVAELIGVPVEQTQSRSTIDWLKRHFM